MYRRACKTSFIMNIGFLFLYFGRLIASKSVCDVKKGPFWRRYVSFKLELGWWRPYVYVRARVCACGRVCMNVCMNVCEDDVATKSPGGARSSVPEHYIVKLSALIIWKYQREWSCAQLTGNCEVRLTSSRRSRTVLPPGCVTTTESNVHFFFRTHRRSRRSSSASTGRSEWTTCRRCCCPCWQSAPGTPLCAAGAPEWQTAAGRRGSRKRTSPPRPCRKSRPGCSRRAPRRRPGRRWPLRPSAGSRRLGKPSPACWRLHMWPRWSSVLTGRCIPRNITVSDPGESPVLPVETREKLS